MHTHNKYSNEWGLCINELDVILEEFNESG